jgi:DNA-binding beta-propeller fold protein YncE
MPRDAVATTDLPANAGTLQPAGVVITPANGAILTGAAGNSDRLVVRVTNTAATPKNLTVKAGVNPPALRAGLGDLVVAITNATERLFVLESARFAQADGSIWVDFEAGMTGIISVVRTPKGA